LRCEILGTHNQTQALLLVRGNTECCFVLFLSEKAGVVYLGSKVGFLGWSSSSSCEIFGLFHSRFRSQKDTDLTCLGHVLAFEKTPTRLQSLGWMKASSDMNRLTSQICPFQPAWAFLPNSHHRRPSTVILSWYPPPPTASAAHSGAGGRPKAVSLIYSDGRQECTTCFKSRTCWIMCNNELVCCI
jgi:hypothetical protein